MNLLLMTQAFTQCNQYDCLVIPVSRISPHVATCWFAHLTHAQAQELFSYQMWTKSVAQSKGLTHLHN